MWPLAFPFSTCHCPASVFLWCLARNEWENVCSIHRGRDLWDISMSSFVVSNHTRLITHTQFLDGRRAPAAPQSKSRPPTQHISRSLPAGLYGSWAGCHIKTRQSCSLNCGIIGGVGEMEKMSHQRGWSKILCEHFSGWKSQMAALSTWKFLSSYLGGHYL